MRKTIHFSSRALSAFNLLKRVGFAVLLLGGTGTPIFGQDWSTPIELTHGYGHGTPYMVVDSLLRVHLFVVRSQDPRPGSGQPNTLVYYLFDNWGRPLRDAYEVLPDSHWSDDGRIGLLLDRQERIHVLWNRYHDNSPPTHSLIYVRLSLDGEFLQEPLILDDNIEPGNYHMVETLSGEVWGACGNQFFAVDANGNVVEPLQYVYRPDSVLSANLMLAASPDGSVWGCLMTWSGLGDRLMTDRFWPPPRIEEITYIAEDVDANQAFNIDVNGAFHYIMYGDQRGLYYRFDSRAGRVEDSTVIDPNPYTNLQGNLILVAEDSLQFYWGRSLPPLGFYRICFTTDGTIGIGPQLIPHSLFFPGQQCAVWRDGGYWIPGVTWDGTVSDLAMLHIPGPNEPLASGWPPSNRNLLFEFEFAAYPNPFNNTLNISLFIPLHNYVAVTLFDLLGRDVDVIHRGRLETTTLSYTAPPELASGTYFLRVETPSQTQMQKISSEIASTRGQTKCGGSFKPPHSFQSACEAQRCLLFK